MILISFGKAIKENTVIGLIASYGYTTYYVNAPYQAKNNQFSAGVFYRKYRPIVKDLYIFGEADAAYFHSRSEQLNSQPDNSKNINTFNGVSASFIPGISYAVCKRMQIELSMPNIISADYSHNSHSTDPATTNQEGDENSFSFNADFNTNLLSNFGIGFKFILGK